MFKLHRKIEYALIALKHMHNKRPGELTSAKEISTLYGAAFDATSRAMQLMAQNGLLKSEQGARGGYQIQKDLNQISIHDFFNMIMGPIKTANCLHEDETQCNLMDSCNIISPITHFNTKLNEFFKEISLRELIDDQTLATEEKTSSFAV